MSETITIYCKNNNTYKDVPIGSSLLDIYTAVGAPLRYRPMNAQVNNKTESLNFRCWQPKDIEFIDYTQLSGLRTYVRSLCHIFDTGCSRFKVAVGQISYTALELSLIHI